MIRRRPPRPQLVGQLVALLPDGQVDPAAATDCGEACVSSAVAVARGLALGPGCLRESLGKPEYDGRTTPDDLGRLCEAFRMDPRVGRSSGPNPASVRRRLRAKRYVALLGYFESSQFLHWVLAYDYGEHGVWVMDPWTATLRPYTWDMLRSQWTGDYVAIRPS